MNLDIFLFFNRCHTDVGKMTPVCTKTNNFRLQTIHAYVFTMDLVKHELPIFDAISLSTEAYCLQQDI